MLISGFFFIFIACIAYMHADMSISKSSASYIAKLQWDEVWIKLLVYGSMSSFNLILLMFQVFNCIFAFILEKHLKYFTGVC